MIYIALDPGDHTGWVKYADANADGSVGGIITGGTIVKNLMQVYTLCCVNAPITIIYETFHLYPAMAKSLAWNEFYPCQVIGVIKLAAQRYNTPIIGQAPSVKKYSGGIQNDAKWSLIKSQEGVTEHTKDALLHLKYYFRSKGLNW